MIARTIAVALAIAFSLSPSHAQPQHRLPSGYKWGRCLLVVHGETRISGRCSYQIEKGGDFNIQGPKQVFAGIDYPDTHSGAGEMSKDYWAVMYKDGDLWAGYGNADIRDTHGEAGDWGELRREGACYVGKDVRVCLWRLPAQGDCRVEFKVSPPDPSGGSIPLRTSSLVGPGRSFAKMASEALAKEAAHSFQVTHSRGALRRTDILSPKQDAA
ncbi:hypothetical protein LB553_04370 [Mesorhizobium sp. CA8]|uniref:hypothetical protein n=1 Tax=Mesorhizobium sp. CA8 TaxID=2876637 RepID=UPI001CCEED34|nr:hypothetical protein [Mesorhizobium sp. CA8]MBZ9760111.1 hypothetical protein [Mesorhizobium sp. CA8]